MNINPNEIHLWHAQDEQITDPHLIELYHQCLNDKERAQQKRFHFEKHRHQYLVTRALIRSVLSFYDDSIPPGAWEFASNAYGKPYINNLHPRLPLCFNLSHTENFISLAVTLDNDVGIDVEYLPRFGNLQGIAENFFSPQEVAAFEHLSVELQQERFFDLWTLKEAYIKACGMGLSIPLNHFSYHFAEDGKIAIEFCKEREDSPEHWHFWQAHPTPAHKLSVAMKKHASPPKISCWEIIPLKQHNQANYTVAYGKLIGSPLEKQAVCLE